MTCKRCPTPTVCARFPMTCTTPDPQREDKPWLDYCDGCKRHYLYPSDHAESCPCHPSHWERHDYQWIGVERIERTSS